MGDNIKTEGVLQPEYDANISHVRSTRIAVAL